MTNAIEGSCKCGHCTAELLPQQQQYEWTYCEELFVEDWDGEENWSPSSQSLHPRNCPDCGYRLRDNGWAYPTVALPERQGYAYFAGLYHGGTAHFVIHEADNSGDEPMFLVIEVPADG